MREHLLGRAHGGNDGIQDVGVHRKGYTTSDLLQAKDWLGLDTTGA